MDDLRACHRSVDRQASRQAAVVLTALAICLPAESAMGEGETQGAPHPAVPGANASRLAERPDESRIGAEPRRLQAVLIASPPEIDGRMGPGEWVSVPADDRFVQKFPDEGGQPTQRTELRVAYDRRALYIAIRGWDTRPDEIVQHLTRRDRETESDRVTIDISSKNDRLSAYHFAVNASGVQVDGIRFDDTGYTTDWDGIWYSAHSQDADGWLVELAIPLSTLRYTEGVVEFGLQVRRYLPRRQEIAEWSYIPRTAAREVSGYGVLYGLEGLGDAQLFEVQPYIAALVTARSNQDALDGITPGLNVGGDLRFGLTPALTLNATVNPDFGQVEADQVVLNLTTLEVLLPEKRAFFLEGSEIFATPFQQFYSRRIGASPPEPVLAPDAALSEPLPLGRIWGAVKLTGLVGPRLSVGLLDAVTARRDASVAGGAGAAESVLVDPVTNFGVLRLKQEFGEQSHVGITGTSVTRFEPAGAAAPGPDDLCPEGNVPVDGRCTRDAHTFGVDTRLRTGDGAWGASGHAVISRIQNGPTLVIPDGTELSSRSVGVGVEAEVGKYGGEHWLGNVRYRAATPELWLNDAGFLELANIHGATGELTWRTTNPLGPLQEASVGLTGRYDLSWDFGDRSFNNHGLAAELVFKNFWSVSGYGVSYLPYYDNRETRDGARTERFGGKGAFEFGLAGSTEPGRKVVVSLESNVFRVLRGLETAAVLTIATRPIPRLELEVIPGVTWTYGDPRWFHTELQGDGTQTYFFGDLTARSFDVTVRSTYAFTPALSLQAYAQAFVASARFGRVTAATAAGDRPKLALDSFRDATMPEGLDPDFSEGVINVNAVIRWELRPGCALMGVYTRNQQQRPYELAGSMGTLRLSPFAGGPAADTVLAKLSCSWAPLSPG